MLLILFSGGDCPQFASPAIAKETSTDTQAEDSAPDKAEAGEEPTPEPSDTGKKSSEDSPKKADGEESTSPAENDQEKETEDSTGVEPGDEQAEVEIEDDEEEEEPEDSESTQPKPPVTEEPKDEEPKVQKRVIGATATIMEKKSEILFRARIDTGAKSCSLHVEDMKIENEAETMADNIGKVVRFHIVNGNKESHWLEAKIAGYVIIKTSNASADRKRRYKVPLTFRWKDVEKTVLVTLNDRDHMDFPLLIGRNFLKGDFVVDVEMDNHD